MKKLSAIIVDDEAPARENLKLMLGSFCPEVEVIELAANVNEAFEKINRLNPDVIFLDIRMPSGSEGFDLLEKFEKKTFQVIFVTAFKEYAIEAFKAHAINYLLKPIDIEDLQNAVKHLTETQKAWLNDHSLIEDNHQKLSELTLRLHNAGGKIKVNHLKGIKVFDTKDIAFLEAKGNCTEINFSDSKRYLDTRTLKIYEELLPGNFFRIHKSFILNLNFLQEYVSDQGSFALLKDQKLLPIAKNRLPDFLNNLKSL
ncbi:MAG: LytTR family DNA-binding domain-containing protein [Bacteroidota bacterium]